MVVEAINTFLAEPTVLRFFIHMGLADPAKLFIVVALSAAFAFVDVHVTVQVDIDWVNDAGLVTDVERSKHEQPVNYRKGQRQCWWQRNGD